MPNSHYISPICLCPWKQETYKALLWEVTLHMSLYPIQKLWKCQYFPFQTLCKCHYPLSDPMKMSFYPLSNPMQMSLYTLSDPVQMSLYPHSVPMEMPLYPHSVHVQMPLYPLSGPMQMSFIPDNLFSISPTGSSGPKPISASCGKRKLGNPSGNLCFSACDRVPSHLVWQYLIYSGNNYLNLQIWNIQVTTSRSKEP